VHVRHELLLMSNVGALRRNRWLKIAKRRRGHAPILVRIDCVGACYRSRLKCMLPDAIQKLVDGQRQSLQRMLVSMNMAAEPAGFAKALRHARYK